MFNKEPPAKKPNPGKGKTLRSWILPVGGLKLSALLDLKCWALFLLILVSQCTVWDEYIVFVLW